MWVGHRRGMRGEGAASWEELQTKPGCHLPGHQTDDKRVHSFKLPMMPHQKYQNLGWNSNKLCKASCVLVTDRGTSLHQPPPQPCPAPAPTGPNQQHHQGLLGRPPWGCKILGELCELPAWGSHPLICFLSAAQDFKLDVCSCRGCSARECQRMQASTVSLFCSVLPSALSWGFLGAACSTTGDVFKILNHMIERVVT